MKKKKKKPATWQDNKGLPFQVMFQIALRQRISWRPLRLKSGQALRLISKTQKVPSWDPPKKGKRQNKTSKL